jgi:hypothetical protein
LSVCFLSNLVWRVLGNQARQLLAANKIINTSIGGRYQAKKAQTALECWGFGFTHGAGINIYGNH